VESVGRKARLELGVLAGLVDAAHDAEAVDFDSLFTTPSRRLREFLAPFSAAIIWLEDDDGRLARGLRACGIDDVRCFPGLPPADWQRHASDYYLDRLLASPMDCRPQAGTVIEQGLSPARLRAGDCPRLDSNAAPIILHPGSGSPKKNWPLDRFHALAAALTAKGHRVQWCRGPAEEDLSPPPGVEVLPEMPLKQLAKHLATARLYIGNDSGITHLAAAVDCPTIALFGPTNPTVWAPRGEHVRVLRGTPWPEVEAVREGVEILLQSDCSALTRRRDFTDLT